MIPKIIIFFIVLVLPLKVCASTNDGQVKFLRILVERGDFNAMSTLGKILYEDGQRKEGLELLTRACTEGKEEYACKYLVSNPNNYQAENNTLTTSISNNRANNADEFDRGKEFYDKQNYTESFPIFSHLCNYESYIPACIYLGRSYAWGAGVKSDPNKALQIYRKYLNEVNDNSLKDVIKLDEAATLEYAIENIDDVDKAMEIYKSLVDSKIDWVQKESKDGLTRAF